MNSIWQMAMAFPVVALAARGASADPSDPDLIFREVNYLQAPDFGSEWMNSRGHSNKNEV